AMHPSLAQWDQPPAASSKLSPPAAAKPTAAAAAAVGDQQKKPRHRHSATQLAALNELYEKNEHPSLEERTALAQRLGMETKTVNSWFQNKRASSKKRHKAPLTQCELPPISALIASVSAPPASAALAQHHHHHQVYEYEDYSDEEHYQPLSHQVPGGAHPPQQHTLFYAGNPTHQHLFEGEGSMPRKARSRPTAAQTEELKKLYERNSHPSKEEREALGDKIGMRYQSVTNWFQNQRSIAKKREEAAAAKALASHDSTPSRAFTPALLPPTSGAAHPSLSVPPPTSHPSLSALLHPPRARRSPSAAPSGGSRPSSPRPSPYHTPADRALDATHRRPRRTRPEPWQLEALKKLFNRTKTPSIEDRQMLAAEIGMDVNKVTNWFRNLRQSDRKRARQNGSASAEEGELDDDESMDLDDMRSQSSVSRTATPGVASSSSAVDYVKIEAEEKPHFHQHSRGPYARSALSRSHSDMGSDEDTLQEAVTPSPESSPPPSAAVASTSSLALPLPHPHARETKASIERYPLEYAQFEKEKDLPTPMPAMETGVKMEDALLLLSFHHSTIVQ
ncbi:homeobox-domain-containing protein, partial [Trametes coccinea BRFM310]